MSGLSESEWLLERLCESLVRLAKKPYVGDGGPKSKEGGSREDKRFNEEDWVDGWVGEAEDRKDNGVARSAEGSGSGGGDAEGSGRGVT